MYLLSYLSMRFELVLISSMVSTGGSFLMNRSRSLLALFTLTMIIIITNIIIITMTHLSLQSVHPLPQGVLDLVPLVPDPGLGQVKHSRHVLGPVEHSRQIVSGFGRKILK